MQTKTQAQTSVELPVIRNRYTNAVIYTGEAGMTTRAMLTKATISGVNLWGANLRGANLYGADLSSANLSSADLRGANLGETYGKLQGERPFFQCGPIGSRSDYLQAFITDKGTVIKVGCFMGFLAEFVKAVEETHGDTKHGKEYKQAVLMIESHVELWKE